MSRRDDGRPGPSAQKIDAPTGPRAHRLLVERHGRGDILQGGAGAVEHDPLAGRDAPAPAATSCRRVAVWSNTIASRGETRPGRRPATTSVRLACTDSRVIVPAASA